MSEKMSLRPEQLAALRILAKGGTKALAAEAADRTERTIDRWMGEPMFQAALREANREKLIQISQAITSAGMPAMGVLLELMRAHNVKPIVRLRAAQTVIDKVLRYQQLVAIDERLTALEDAVGRAESDE